MITVYHAHAAPVKPTDITHALTVVIEKHRGGFAGGEESAGRFASR